MAEIDLHGITYSVVAVMPNGEKIYLNQAAENIAWEENEGELATRLNLTLRDTEITPGVYLASKLALGTRIYLYSTWAGTQREIFRGTIWTWENPPFKNEQITITCYDVLYFLQKSKDNRYYAKGTSTLTVVTSLLADHNIALAQYTGPDIAHEKLVYKGQTLAAMMTDVLKTADENTNSRKTIVRASGGEAEIVGQGENTEVYGFNAGQIITGASESFSMVDLVTKVIVTGKESEDGNPPVEATLNGNTSFGLLQEIHSKGDTTLQEAMNAAQRILDEKGAPTRKISIPAPEFPAIRKGDRIHVMTERMSGYFMVKGVSHNATTAQMKMEVEPA